MVDAFYIQKGRHTLLIIIRQVMDKVRFQKGVPGDFLGRVPAYIPFFYQPEFVLRYGESGIITYSIYSGNILLALIHFQIVEKTAISLPMSSFGGIGIVKEVPDSDLRSFMNYIIDDLRQLDMQSVTIRECPKSYRHYLNANDIYTQLGFTQLFSEANQFVNVGKAFTDLINRNRKRSLSQSDKLNLISKQIEPGYLKEAFDLLQANRQVRGLELTMTYDQLNQAFEQFPNRYLLFGVFDQDKLIAASICIAVNGNVLYDFYHGELPEYTSTSPVTMLVATLYQYANSNKFQILDFGISSVKGKLDKGLFMFKKSLGAKVERKEMYQLEL